MKKNIEKYRKWLLLGGSILIYLFVCLLFYQLRMKGVFENNLVAQVENTSNSDITVNELSQGIVVAQSFAAEEEISGFSLLFATLDRQNAVTVHISLKETKTQKEVYKTSIQASEIQDNKYQTFLCEPKVPAGSYTIFVESPEGKPGNAVTLWATSVNTYDGGFLAVSGQQAPGDLAFEVFGHSNALIFQTVFFWLVFAGACLTAVLFLYLSAEKLPVEKFFLLCIIPLGCLYGIVFSPFTVPDEYIHENTAYYYSNKLMFQEAKINGESSLKGINTAQMEIRNEDLQVQSDGIAFHYDVLDKHNHGLFETAGGSSSVEENVYAYSFLLYFPAAVGITIGRLLHLSGIALLYIGRIFNFAAFTALAYWGMKKAPVGKLLLCMTALLPMTIHQAISYSCDSLIFGMTIFVTGYSLYAAFGEDRLTKKTFCILTAACALFAPCKIVYVPLAFLPIIIQRKSFSSRKQYIQAMGVFAGGAAFSWLFSNARNFLSVLRGSDSWLEHADMQGFSLSFLWKQPGEFLNMIWNTLVQNGTEMIMQAVGIDLGALNIRIPVSLIIGFVILLILAAMEEQKEAEQGVQLTVFQKLWIGCIALGIFMAILISELLFWTPVGYSVIAGIQGRYFVPMIPLLLLLLRNRQLVFRKSAERRLLSAAMFLQLFVIFNGFSTIAAM